MVGRLVEKQHVGTLQKNLCKLDTHTPSTAELACLTVEILTFETKTAKSTLNLADIVSTTKNIKFLVSLSQTVDQLVVRLALIISTFSKLSPKFINFSLEFRDVGESLLSLLHHSAVVVVDHVLRKITDSRLLRDSHRTLRQSLDARENLQHS